jgi:UDP-N-acetylmuramate--alanine ligase
MRLSSKQLLNEMLQKKEGRVYFIGLKGAGVSALAQVLQYLGLEILGGSDTSEKFWTDRVLKRAGIEVTEGFSEWNIPENVDLIIASEAYYKHETNSKFQTNIEVEYALERGLPILTYPEALSLVFNRFRFPVAVAGTHGKSTTAAMLGEILETAGLDPIVLIGAENLNWQSNVRLPAQRLTTNSQRQDQGIMVIEADEWQTTAFVNYQPQVLVITNIEWDHPDHFSTVESYQRNFDQLISKVPEHRAVITPNETQEFELQVPGQYNQSNAAAAALAARKIGVTDQSLIKKALKNYQGLRRRFELLGYYPTSDDQIPIIDDYAHHPKEIEALMQAIKEAYPERQLILVFQPHTFSRTKALFEDFIHSLQRAPGPVLLVKTYSSAREQSEIEWALKLQQELVKRGQKSYYFSNNTELRAFLKANLELNHVVALAGAGDLWQVGHRLRKSE